MSSNHFIIREVEPFGIIDAGADASKGSMKGSMNELTPNPLPIALERESQTSNRGWKG